MLPAPSGQPPRLGGLRPPPMHWKERTLDCEWAAPSDRARSTSAVKQVQHRADNLPGDGARQIPDVNNMLVCTGMLGHGVGVILSTEPR